MPPMETQAWPSRSLSVVKGPITKFYFIPITGVGNTSNTWGSNTDFTTSYKRVPTSGTYGTT